jgi:prolyl-tRNA synthetase
MASQTPTDVPATEAAPQVLPDRTQAPADNQPDVTKNAAKKAAKLAKLQAAKADKKAGNGPEKAKKAEKGEKGIGKQEAKKAPKKKVDGAALIGIDVSKEEDFPGWYQQVLTKGDMLDYYDVSGCFILKPSLFFIWEEIQGYFNKAIKKIGVKNCSFPLFVSEDVLQREKDHIEGFAAEVAWVTHAYEFMRHVQL